MRRLAIPGVALALACDAAILLAQPTAQSVLQRIVDRTITIHLTDDCSVPAGIVLLARILRVPAGAEHLPGKCFTAQRRGETQGGIDLLGLTLEEATDRLVAADPRYRWTESAGVIVVRPLASWGDPNNFLNHPVGQFELREVHMGGALDVIAATLRGRYSEMMGLLQMRSEEGNRRFSLNTGPTSVAGALNAVVRAHGGLVWEAHGHTKTAYGDQDGSIFLTTFEMTDGIGASTKINR